MDPNIFDAYQNLTYDPTNMSAQNVLSDISYSTLVAKQLYAFENGPVKQDIITNQQRLIKIDRFYIDKYKAQTTILKQIIFFCCLGLIGAIFYNKQIISLDVFNFYLIVLFSVLLYYTGYGLYDIYSRDNQNFDEYDFGTLTDMSMNSIKTKKNGNFDFLFEESKIPSCYA